MEKLIKILVLINNSILISEIVEVGADVGEPDCKLTNPFLIDDAGNMSPFMGKYTTQSIFMISSDKILTLADPTDELMSKYYDSIA